MSQRTRSLARQSLSLLSSLALTSLGACADDDGYVFVDNGGGSDTGGGGTDTGGGGGTDDPQPNDNGDAFAEYVTPETEEGLAVEEFLQSGALPEAFVAAVNAQWALPFDLPVFLAECGVANAFYESSDPQIVMCHELTLHIYGAFAQLIPDDDESAAEATISTWFLVAFHEMGHALIDLHDIPITGREEDAADDLATLVMIEAGLGAAALDAGYYFYLTDSGEYPASAMADEHGLGMQRFYNIACTVYGSDPASYNWLAEAFPEMESRLPRCESEYTQKVESWTTLLADVML